MYEELVCPQCGFKTVGTLAAVLAEMKEHRDKCVFVNLGAGVCTHTWPFWHVYPAPMGPDSTTTKYPTDNVTLTAQAEIPET